MVACPGHDESLPSVSDDLRVRPGGRAFLERTVGICVWEPESLFKTSESHSALMAGQVPGN